VAPKSNARLGYVLFQLVCVAVAFVLMYTLKPAADNIDFISCNSSSGQGIEDTTTPATETTTAADIAVNILSGAGLFDKPDPEEAGSACFGVSAVLRMTFALFLTHALILFLILPRNSCAAVIHDGGWCFKFLLAIGLFIGFFWIPIDFFSVWASISRYVSILFLIIQVLYILAGAYTFNEYMVGEEDENQSCRFATLMFYTVCLVAGSFTLIGLSFVWFLGRSTEEMEAAGLTDYPECGDNMAFIIVTIVMQVLVFALRCR